MANTEFFHLPGGAVAGAGVIVDPETGFPRGGGGSNPRVTIIGRCADVDDALRDTWSGPTPLYVFPAAPIRMQIVSADAGDTAAGAGVRTVMLHYLDANYIEREELLTLNGVTPVLTVATNILRVNNLRAVSIGANGVSSGAISLTSVGGGITYSNIPISRNCARQAIYTVPAGKKLIVDQWKISSGSLGENFCRHTLVASSYEGEYVPAIFLPKDEQGTQNNGAVIDYPFTLEQFPARTDVKVAAQANSSTANVFVMTAIFGTLYPAS
jgi:hypothetical protein